MTEGFDIFCLGEADASLAGDYLDALLPDDWRDGPLPRFEQMRAALADPCVILMVAGYRDEPAGYASGFIMKSLTARPAVVMLDDLFVCDADREKGLGAALIAAFRKEAARRIAGPFIMWSGTGVDNDACRRAFEKSGAEAADEIYQEFVWPCGG